jgi:hypothetical protein
VGHTRRRGVRRGGEASEASAFKPTGAHGHRGAVRTGGRGPNGDTHAGAECRRACPAPWMPTGALDRAGDGQKR